MAPATAARPAQVQEVCLQGSNPPSPLPSQIRDSSAGGMPQRAEVRWVGAHGALPDVVPRTVPADPTLTRGRSVINVIVPEGRAHFFQQLGYVLATLLLFILLLITVVLATRQRRRGGELIAWLGSVPGSLSQPEEGLTAQ